MRWTNIKESEPTQNIYNAVVFCSHTPCGYYQHWKASLYPLSVPHLRTQAGKWSPFTARTLLELHWTSPRFVKDHAVLWFDRITFHVVTQPGKGSNGLRETCYRKEHNEIFLWGNPQTMSRPSWVCTSSLCWFVRVKVIISVHCRPTQSCVLVGLRLEFVKAKLNTRQETFNHCSNILKHVVT